MTARPPERAPSAPTAARSAAPAVTATPSSDSFRVNDLKPAPF